MIVNFHKRSDCTQNRKCSLNDFTISKSELEVFKKTLFCFTDYCALCMFMRLLCMETAVALTYYTTFSIIYYNRSKI